MVTIKLFATLKDLAKQNELSLPFGGGTVGDLLLQVARDYPSLAPALASGRMLVSVNQEFARPESPVRDGDEIALMPPFSGGDLSGCVRVQEEPFSAEQEIARLKSTSSSIGGFVAFVGTTRDISKDRAVSTLHFEHYPGMAEKKLAEIRERAIGEFGAIDVTIIHRVGTIPVGDDIVLIIAAAMHRDEAFRACRFCIDELKRITPIWKRETTKDGEVWVEEHP